MKDGSKGKAKAMCKDTVDNDSDYGQEGASLSSSSLAEEERQLGELLLN